jgi:DNA-binding CsgD family transcriptional regulator
MGRSLKSQTGSGMKKKNRATLRYPTAGAAPQPGTACPLSTVCQQLGVTAREHDVCQWLMQGKTNAEIAAILRISPRTAEKHVHKLLTKLGVENRAAAGLELARRVWYPQI